MVTLYVMSMESFAGKTVLCLGLARRLANDGLSVGYIQPLTTSIRQISSAQSSSSIVKRSLGLMESIECLTPVIIDSEILDWIFSGKTENLSTKVSEAFSTASSGKDVMVVEGTSRIAEGSMVDLDAKSTAEMFDAKCLLVIRAANELTADRILFTKRWLGDRMLGVVLNVVPLSMADFFTNSFIPFLERKGVKVYAAIPQDKLLLAATVGDIVERLGGRVVTSQDRMEELVEHVMVGAMSVENALNYFRRKPNKVVITGGDRPDIQLAALETSTRCLVLTGNVQPSPMILGRAEELGVPIILVQQDTLAAAALVEQAFSEVQFHQEKKMKRFERMLEASFKYEELKRDLGITAAR
ncbi:MAG: phosphotransacetylase family protein [Chloroflexota bacterium]|jgi:BioD-like phosphotransacetylase family protein